MTADTSTWTFVGAETAKPASADCADELAALPIAVTDIPLLTRSN
ncbi:MAG TPA: hypothetical protein V6C88_09515 [Chroococcidiopsis sp.]